MKLLFRSYLASLREREELDAILPDLLSELGYTVYSRPQRGTTQAGVDIAAVGTDEDGERKLFLFSIKQGDLSRQSWDGGTPQALRSSLNEILDVYIPTKVPKRYQKLRVVICLVFGGDMQEQVRSSVKGYIEKNSTDLISFDEWNGDKIAGLLMQGVLREEIMPKALRSHFQKAVALVDEPDVSYKYFRQLVTELRRDAKDGKTRVRVARQIYIALWVLFVWSRDIDNVESAYQASELVLLTTWDLLRPCFGKKPDTVSRAIESVLYHAVQLYLTIGATFIEQKILPHVGVLDGISMSINTRSSVDVNLLLFDVLGRISLTGLWLNWVIERDSIPESRAIHQQKIAMWATACYKLINNNGALYLPLQDQQAIDVSLFLIFAGAVDANRSDLSVWLGEMVDRLSLTVKNHGRYPCVFTDYRELVSHPRERTDDYRQDAMAGSTLIPLLASYAAAIKDHDKIGVLSNLTKSELQHCTLQLWLPDALSDEKIYVGVADHGLALLNLRVSGDGTEPLRTIREACSQSTDFNELSAISRGFWPMLLTACRHFKFPVPPQFWIEML